jgi:hypothetical protein
MLSGLVECVSAALFYFQQLTPFSASLERPGQRMVASPKQKLAAFRRACEHKLHRANKSFPSLRKEFRKLLLACQPNQAPRNSPRGKPAKSSGVRAGNAGCQSGSVSPLGLEGRSSVLCRCLRRSSKTPFRLYFDSHRRGSLPTSVNRPLILKSVQNRPPDLLDATFRRSVPNEPPERKHAPRQAHDSRDPTRVRTKLQKS